MSSASPFRSEVAASTRQRLPARSLERLVRSPLRFVGFWAAVVLPFVLLALVASGLATQHPTVAGGLVAGNLAGLLLGRGYKQ
jgi:hypothetical protein